MRRSMPSQESKVTIEAKLGRKALNAAVSVNMPSLTVPLSDELQGSLRTLKVQDYNCVNCNAIFYHKSEVYTLL